MTMQVADPKDKRRGSRPSAGDAQAPVMSKIISGLAIDRIGAVYVLLAIIVVFTIWAPHSFPNIATVQQVLDSNAITALGALAIMIPLTTRTFDLSFAYVMTLSGAIATWLITNNMSVGVAIVIALLASAAVGVVNGIVVVGLKIDSFIGTLATGSIVLALVTMVTGDVPITSQGLNGFFAKIGQTSAAGITIGVVYCAVIGIIVWFVLEHTATGRRMYATGFNPDAARLAGVHTQKLRFVSLIASSFIAGFAGIVLASVLATGSPTAGDPYLLQCFAAVFVGATQFKQGRFNVAGTFIAVILLGTGTAGLGLTAAPTWSPDIFVGVVLIAALAITGAQSAAVRRSRRAPKIAAPSAQ
jgi:ribose transport system permease protein